MSLFNEQPKIGQELLDVPMGDMIRQMAFAIAEAQIKLDSNSMEVAQMMGGLQTITEEINGEEIVTFQDSRVFFGQEKYRLADAIDIHNTSADIELRARIRQSLGDANYEVIDLVKIPGASKNKADIGTPNSSTDLNKFYEVNTGSAAIPVFEYYKYVGNDVASTPQFEKLTQYHTNIKKKGNLSDTQSILLPTRVSMLELGFSPTFYQFVDTMIEVKISIKYTQEGSYTRTTNTNRRSSSFKAGAMFIPGLGGGIAAGRAVTTTQVNATYSQKYSYSAEGSSFLRTKLVPIPPPAILEERIRAQMELAKEQNKTT